MVVKAIEMIREIREKQYEKIKNLSVEEKIKYFKEKAEKLKEEMKKFQKVK